MKLAFAMLTSLSVVACSAADSGTGVTRPPAPGSIVPDAPGTAGSTGTPSGPNSPPSGQFAAPDDVSNNGEDPNCGLQYFDVVRRPTDVLLVLDRSASMQDAPDGATVAGSKWDLTVPALNQVILETDAGVSWGMKVFPEGQDNGSCSPATINDLIHVPIASANGTTVVNAIATTTPEGDGTPTGDAIRAAVGYLSNLVTPDRKYIVLATDGEPSCSPSGEGQENARPYAVTAVRESLAAGIPVFVVGVATTKDTATQALNDMALAGGAARPDPNPLATRYYLANTQAELVNALRSITGEIASCVFPLSAPPPVPNNIGVKLDGMLLPRDPSRANGWEYTSEALTEVEVHGPWCDQIKGAAASAVQVIYACEGVVIY